MTFLPFVAVVAQWSKSRTRGWSVMMFEPIIDENPTSRGGRCTLHLFEAQTPSSWCGVEARRGGYQFSHLTMVQNY
ncbi:hypothetical protein TNCV_2944861 [Trichonephila clavipes]|nr:hypothetical protein TNCV_2944861 [Trichonephila clavipes]